jgi:uncharacterized membrane protein
MKNNGSKDNSILIILTLLLLVLFCIVAVNTKAIDFFDMPASFLGAALGAVITAVVTLFLLRGQEKAAEEKERNVKIFQLKKKAFTRYINKVWQIWADQRIDDIEFEDLCSSFYKDIAMFLKKPEKSAFHKVTAMIPKKSEKPDKLKKPPEPGNDKSKAFIDCLIEIGNCLGEETKNSYNSIKKNVFNIVNILVEDLELGGKIDEDQHTRLMNTLLPGFFKKAIEKEIFNVLHGKSRSFLHGKYEPFYYDNNEYLCFYCDTEKTTGVNFAKIIIGPLKEWQNNNDGKTEWIDKDMGIYFCADKEQNGWRPNENMPYLGQYKAGKAGEWYRIISTKGVLINSISKPLECTDVNKKIDDLLGDSKIECHLNFGKTAELSDNYSFNYKEIAKVLAKRVEIFFDLERIDIKDMDGNPTGESLSIIEFMKLYNLIE